VEEKKKDQEMCKVVKEEKNNEERITRGRKEGGNVKEKKYKTKEENKV
jgi:hypothetical protein